MMQKIMEAIISRQTRFSTLTGTANELTEFNNFYESNNA